MNANQENLLASIRVHSRLITGIEKKVSGSETSITRTSPFAETQNRYFSWPRRGHFSPDKVPGEGGPVIQPADSYMLRLKNAGIPPIDRSGAIAESSAQDDAF